MPLREGDGFGENGLSLNNVRPDLASAVEVTGPDRREPSLWFVVATGLSEIIVSGMRLVYILFCLSSEMSSISSNSASSHISSFSWKPRSFSDDLIAFSRIVPENRDVPVGTFRPKTLIDRSSLKIFSASFK